MPARVSCILIFVILFAAIDATFPLALLAKDHDAKRENRIVAPAFTNGCRKEMSSASRNLIVQNAVTEWINFGRQALDAKTEENITDIPGLAPVVAPTLGTPEGRNQLLRIAAYWSVVPNGSFQIARQNAIWKKQPAEPWHAHWSAAFTSWVMCKSGLSDQQFQRSAAHSDYVRQAARAKQSQFYIQSGSDVPLTPGDMTCLSRDDGIGLDSKVVNDKLSDNTRWSLHCFIVVSAQSKIVLLIGGNVPDWSRKPIREFGSVVLLRIGIQRGKLMPINMPASSTRLEWVLKLINKASDKFDPESLPPTYRQAISHID